MTLPPLPPLPTPGLQQPLPFPASGTNSFPERIEHNGALLVRQPLVLPPLPPLPPRRIYSEGVQVSDWFPMRVTPCADRPGFYEVKFDNAPESREWWNGKSWPSLAGNFHATGWRGAANAPAPTAKEAQP